MKEKVLTTRRNGGGKTVQVRHTDVISLEEFRRSHPPEILEVNGVAWEYLALGKGNEAVLFLSGLAGAYEIWWQQMAALQDRYRIISVTYPAADGLRELAGGLLAILDREGIERATVVGSSLGGYLAQYLLAVHPERVERAVFGNTYADCDLIEKRFRLAGSLLPHAPEWLVKAVLRASYQSMNRPNSRFSNRLVKYLCELTNFRTSKAQLEARYRAVIEPFLLPDASNSEIPILILESDNDPLIEPSLRENLRRAYPGASIYTFRGAGHFPYLVAPEEYLRVLESFLGGRG